MRSIETLKEQIHDILIKKDGDVKLSEHREIINEAKDLGLDERQLSKLLQEVDSAINWDFIRKQKEEATKREEEFKRCLVEQKKKEENASETLQFIIEQCSKDKVFDAKEVAIFFETADELNQEENKSAKILKDFFSTNNYIPLTTPKGTSLRLSLQSTDWYKDKLPPPPQPPPPPFPWKQLIAAVILILLVGSGLGYVFWLKPYLRDKNAVRKYTYVDNLSLRSSPVSGIDNNFLQKLNYGTEVLVYDSTVDWATVKANGQEGYVSNEFILNKKDFYELNGLFGDAESKTAVVTSKCKKAVLDYFRKNNIMGKIDATIQIEIYGAVQNKEVWQVFAKDKDISPNTVIYTKLINPHSKFTDFGFLITNIKTNKRKFIFYTFTDMGEPVFIHDEDAPDSGYIKSLSRYFNNNQYVYNIKYVN